MRRTLSAVAAVLIAAALTFVAPSSALAVDAPPPPVAPVPDLPSRAVKTNVGQPVGLAAMWKSMKYAQGMVGATAPAPKPITTASVFARGAAGGPLIGAFAGGFTIGTAGLDIYAQVTGENPLATVCGTAVEGLSSVIYMGLAPDCKAAIAHPNADATGGIIPMTYAGLSYSYQGTWNPPAGDSKALCYTATVPAGHSLRTVLPNGSWSWMGHDYPYYCQQIGKPGSSYWNTEKTNAAVPPRWRLVRNSDSAVVAQETVAPSGNPTRTPKCRITWEDGTLTEALGSTYGENDGFPVSRNGTGCEYAWTSKPGAGPDLMPSRIQIESDDGSSITQIADQQVPSWTTAERESMKDNGNRSGLVLERVVGTVADSCMTWAADCSGWWTQTSEGTNPTTETAEYRCTYNGAAVELTQCGVYRHTFDTRTGTPTITDPQTGQSQPWLSNTPTNTVNPAIPVPGTQNQNCMDAWASLNPIDWVLVPVKCALQWAFVPRAEVVTATWTGAMESWNGTMPGQLPGVVGAAFAPPQSPGGCAGPHVQIDFSSVNSSWPDFDGHPLSACSGAAAVAAMLARTIGAAVMIFMTGLGLVRRFSSTVNAPGIGTGSS